MPTATAKLVATAAKVPSGVAQGMNSAMKNNMNSGATSKLEVFMLISNKLPGTRPIIALKAIPVMPTTQLNQSHGIAIDNDDNVYVVDSDARRVLKLAAGADTPTELPFGGLTRPWGVTVDKDKNVYVSDPDPHRILRLAAGATASTEVHFPGLDSALGLAVNKYGDLYVVNCHKSDNCATGKVLALGVGS